MVRLIYASRFETGVGPNHVQDILRVSREHNPKAGITGVLCYDPRYFLQVLEGPREKVNELYATIAGDTRHKEVTILAYREVDVRLFEEWSMAYVRMDGATRAICDKFCIDGTFDPYAMTADEALGFAKDLSTERQLFLESLSQ